MNKQDIDDWLVSMLSGFNLAIHFPHLKKNTLYLGNLGATTNQVKIT